MSDSLSRRPKDAVRFSDFLRVRNITRNVGNSLGLNAQVNGKSAAINRTLNVDDLNQTIDRPAERSSRAAETFFAQYWRQIFSDGAFQTRTRCAHRAT